MHLITWFNTITKVLELFKKVLIDYNKRFDVVVKFKFKYFFNTISFFFLGNAGCSDFRAFRQDPPRTCDIRCDGCHYRIWLALRIGFSVALVIFAIVALAQVFKV